MTEKMLIVAPQFDTATQYCFNWALNFINKAKNNPTIEYSILLDNATSISNFDNLMPFHDSLIFFDHGSEDALIGQNGVKLVTTKTVGKLTGKKVFAMACLSALELGTYAYHNGCLEYWGAIEPIGFTLVDEQLFGEVYVQGACQRFIENCSIDEVMNNMSNHFDEQKEKTSNPWTKIWLEKDKDIWVCWHAGNPPNKPKELTWWEKIIELIVELLKAIGVLETKTSDFVIS